MIETFSVKVAIASTSTKTPRAVAVPGDSKPKRRTAAAGISAAWPPAGCVPPTRATLGPDRSGNVTADQLICHPRGGWGPQAPIYGGRGPHAPRAGGGRLGVGARRPRSTGV